MTPDAAAFARRVTEFWQSIDRSGGPDECWPWTGYTDDEGYGQFYIDGKMCGAHELAVTFTTGEVRSPGLDTCHSCDRPPCCNPRHVRFDTRLGNVREMQERGRGKGNARLTPEHVRELRERRAAGARQQDLAQQYGISDGQVSMIVRGIRWRTAGGPLQTERAN